MARRLLDWRGALLALLVLLVTVPAIDLAVAGWFYVPGQGFPWRVHPLGEIMRKSVPPVLFALALAVAALGAAAWWMRRTLLGVTPRIAAYVLGSLLIGPGLIVNVLLKDHWGRARPSQIVDFGGGARFSPALWLSDQCTDNCSFASGHGALGFWVLCFALLAPPRWRGWAVAAALAFGTAMSVTRMAQGGHFLSDVAFSGAITVAVIVVLHRWLVGKRL